MSLPLEQSKSNHLCPNALLATEPLNLSPKTHTSTVNARTIKSTIATTPNTFPRPYPRHHQGRVVGGVLRLLDGSWPRHAGRKQVPQYTSTSPTLRCGSTPRIGGFFSKAAGFRRWRLVAHPRQMVDGVRYLARRGWLTGRGGCWEIGRMLGGFLGGWLEGFFWGCWRVRDRV